MNEPPQSGRADPVVRWGSLPRRCLHVPPTTSPTPPVPFNRKRTSLHTASSVIVLFSCGSPARISGSTAMARPPPASDMIRHRRAPGNASPPYGHAVQSPRFAQREAAAAGIGLVDLAANSGVIPVLGTGTHGAAPSQGARRITVRAHVGQAIPCEQATKDWPRQWDWRCQIPVPCVRQMRKRIGRVSDTGLRDHVVASRATAPASLGKRRNRSRCQASA